MKKETSSVVRKEQLEAAMHQLETSVRDMFESGRFQDYLLMLSKFHNYSFNNILLAFAQNPNISRLASYQTWRSLHMQVRRGEKAIKILCPIPYQYSRERNRTDEKGNIVLTAAGDEEKEIIIYQGVRFRIGNVFDISQCDGHLDSLIEIPADNSESLKEAVKKLMDSDSRIMYDPKLMNGSANGFFSPLTGEIHIKENMPALMTLRCICHEKAHSILHGKEAADSDRGVKEIEAEAASFLVCSALGYPQTLCYSTGYLAGWSQSRTTRELLQSVNRIEKTSHEILNWITNSTDLKVLE